MASLCQATLPRPGCRGQGLTTLALRVVAEQAVGQPDGEGEAVVGDEGAQLRDVHHVVDARLIHLQPELGVGQRHRLPVDLHLRRKPRVRGRGQGEPWGPPFPDPAHAVGALCPPPPHFLPITVGQILVLTNPRGQVAGAPSSGSPGGLGIPKRGRTPYVVCREPRASGRGRLPQRPVSRMSGRGVSSRGQRGPEGLQRAHVMCPRSTPPSLALGQGAAQPPAARGSQQQCTHRGPPTAPPAYLHPDGHHLHGLDQHLLCLVAHDERAGAGHFIVDVTVVVVDVDPKVVHPVADLLHQHIRAVALVAVVEPVEGDVVRVPPARAVACGGSGVSSRRAPNWGRDRDRTCSRLGWEGQTETAEGPAVGFPGHSGHLGPKSAHAPRPTVARLWSRHLCAPLSAVAALYQTSPSLSCTLAERRNQQEAGETAPDRGLTFRGHSATNAITTTWGLQQPPPGGSRRGVGTASSDSRTPSASSTCRGPRHARA